MLYTRSDEKMLKSDHVILAEIEGSRSVFTNLLVPGAKNSQMFSASHLKYSLVYISQILIVCFRFLILENCHWDHLNIVGTLGANAKLFLPW